MTPFAWRAACGALVMATPMLQPSALARPDPRDASAAVPPLVHTPAHARRPALAASGAVTWRDANDEVGRLGGWRAYARESQSAASVPTPAPAPAPVHKH